MRPGRTSVAKPVVERMSISWVKAASASAVSGGGGLVVVIGCGVVGEGTDRWGGF